METAPRRVNYREDQRLRATDLTAEQEYLIERERSHNRTLHSSGIVLGLDVRAGLTTALAHQPGVCIDEEGRLLALEQMQEIAARSEGQCVDSWLVSCAAPGRIRRPGLAPCGPDAYDRLSEFVRVVNIPVAPADIPVAPEPRAVYLGRTHFDPADSASPVAPEPGSAYAGDTNSGSQPDIPYTFLGAAEAAGPRGDMVMRVGPRNSHDRDGFTVGAADETVPRLAIDRLGVNRLNGTVTLSDYLACARVNLPNGQRLIVRAREPGAAGRKLYLRIKPERTGAPRSLRIDLFSGVKKLGESVVLNEGDDQSTLFAKLSLDVINPKVATALPSFESRSTLSGSEASPSPPATGLEFFDADQDISLSPCGGILELRNWSGAVGVVPAPPRGCLPPVSSDDPVREPSGLSFEPMPTTPKAPPLPGAYSVQTGDAKRPAQEFRLDLGEKRDNDQTTRFSVVNSDADQPYFEWVRISGVGTMQIAGSMPKPKPSLPSAATASSAETAQPLPVRLRVNGSLQPAPIKPDPLDPEFTTRLVEAWVSGLQSSVQASTVVNLTFNPPFPALIEAGKQWTYDTVITNNSSKEITVAGALETRTVVGLPSPLQKNISDQVKIPPGEQKTIPVVHQPNDTPVGSLTIEIRVFGQIGNSHWWKSRVTDPIPVVQSPSIDLSGFPDSVPPETPWQQSFVIRNDASIALTLDSVTIAEENDTPLALEGMPLVVPAGGSHTFDKLSHDGITDDVRFTVNANFTWAGGLASSISYDKIVRVSPEDPPPG